MMVSVIIPCYNSEIFIADAIESCLIQTYPELEIIVVDDGSTDNTIFILRKFAEFISIIRQSNYGACAARNRGLAAAKGEYVKFLDADDILQPGAIARQISAISDYGLSPNEIVFGDHITLLSDGSYQAAPGHYGVLAAGSEAPLEWMLSVCPMTTSPLFPAHAARSVGGYDPSVQKGQEFNFHIRLAFAGWRFFYVPGVVYARRDHSGGRISNSSAPHFLSDPDNIAWVWSELRDLYGGGVPSALHKIVGDWAWNGGLGATARRQTADRHWRLAASISNTRPKHFPHAIWAVVALLGPSLAASTLLRLKSVKDRIVSTTPADRSLSIG